jgi:hypothetical protein
MNIGELTDRLHEIREDLRQLAAQDKLLRSQYDVHERQLMALLDEQGTTIGRGQHASVTLSEETYANPKDWEEIFAYIHENNAFHLIQRRLASAAVIAEIAAEDSPIPGVEITSRRKLGLRSL